MPEGYSSVGVMGMQLARSTILTVLLCLPIAVKATTKEEIQKIERQRNLTVGIALVDDGGTLLFGHRETQRFAMCSTFKLPLAAATLKQIESGKWSAAERLSYSAGQLDAYAPAAKRYLPTGYITVAEANQASVQLSDNTAANLLLDKLGGPSQLTSMFRSLGDSVSRLDRREPDLNTNVSGDPRDTTTPGAMARIVAKLVYGNYLSTAGREQLQRLLIGNNTGDSTIRAGIASGWTTGDKTGSCDNGGRNDAAFLVSPDGRRFALTVYLNAPSLDDKARNEVVATVARLAVESIR